MDFAFRADEEAWAERMRVLGHETAAAPPSERLARLGRGGALGLCLPVEHGGAGLSCVATAHAYAALGETLPDAGTLLAAGAHLFGVAATIAKAGNEAQRARWLPGLASGAVLATVAATEEAAGSDVAAVTTTVEPRPEGGYRVHGTKRFVTTAAAASLFFLVGKAGGAKRGLSAVLVPGGTDGIAVGAPWPTAGLANARLAPVTFADVVVPADALLGREGAGLAVFQIAMAYERALVLAFRLGALERALRDAIAFARRRSVGGAPIASRDAVLHRIARLKLRVESSRWLVYRAAWALDRGERGQLEAALAKWHLGDAAIASSLDAIALRGGAGYVDPALAGDLLDGVGNAIHSGTPDVLAAIVARWLGL